MNRPTNTRRLILPTDHKRRLHEWKINHHDSKRQRTGHQTRTSRTYTEDFNKDRANLIAADAAVSAGVLKAATDYRGVRALPRDFSIELKQGSITNQERSGRCWMFAS